MSMTDPIGDLLTRIRNASRAGHKKVSIPSSRLKREVVRVLQENHYVRGFVELPNDRQNELVVRLRYTPEQEPVISGIRRISRPGLRQYAAKERIRARSRQLGVTVVSTSHGVMTSQQALQAGLGGELICHVW